MDPISEPMRDLRLVLRVLKSFISHNDHAKVILVPDYSPNCLVYSPGSLKIVPFLPANGFGIHLSPLVKVVSFEDDLWVLVVWIGDAEHDDTPSGIIREVDALAQFPSANAHQKCTCVAVIFPHANDLTPETLELGFELVLVGGLYKYAFLAKGLNPCESILRTPLLRVVIKHLVGWEEEEDTSYYLFTDLLKNLPQLNDL